MECKTRSDVANFIKQQLDHTGYETITGRPKPNTHHYGVQELRELLDYIYGSQPSNISEEINIKC